MGALHSARRATASSYGTMIYTLQTLAAREGVTEDGILATHPAITRRVEELRALQEPCFEPLSQVAAAPPVTRLPKTLSPQRLTRVIIPPDPRADWSERYKRMGASADSQAAAQDDAKPHGETGSP